MVSPARVQVLGMTAILSSFVEDLVPSVNFSPRPQHSLAPVMAKDTIEKAM